MKSLDYFGKPMKVEPTRVRCIAQHGPLEGDEPSSIHDIRFLLDSGYTMFVNLQPGDGTQYGLLLAPLAQRQRGCTVMRVGPANGAVVVSPDVALQPEDCAPLSNNPWSQQFFAWWLNHLVSGDDE